MQISVRRTNQKVIVSAMYKVNCHTFGGVGVKIGDTLHFFFFYK